VPNLYNRPRWTIPYLVEQLRTHAPVGLVVVLASSCLLLLGGVTVPPGLEDGVTTSWRLRVSWAVAAPLAALLRFTGLMQHPSLTAAPAEAALLITHALAAAAATWLSTRLLLASGFKCGMRLRVGLLLGFGTTLACSAWQPGSAALGAACVALTAAQFQAYRRHGERRDLAIGGVGLALGALVDPRSLAWLPFLALAMGPAPVRRRLTLGATVVAALALVVFAGLVLPEAERAFLFAYLVPGEVGRRVLAAALGVGSSLLVAAPPAALALLGLPGLVDFDRPLAVMTVGGALAITGARLLFVLDPHEAQVTLESWATILPLLAPAMGFGLLALRRRREGAVVVVVLALIGAAGQAQRFLLDPSFVAQRIHTGSMEFPLDRSFTPEVAEPVVGIRLIRAWFAGDDALPMSLPSVRERWRFQVQLTGLQPRPWPARLARWVRSEDPRDPSAVLGQVRIGGRKFWVGLLGAVTAWFLLSLGMLSLAVLGERLTSFAKMPVNHRT
jgi:hypothetical protein